jgi:hypothetical protein
VHWLSSSCARANFISTKEDIRWLPNNKPVTTLRCGSIKATIWKNVSEKGPFFSTTFSRPFKGQSGEWRNGTSFGLNDLEALLIVVHQAKEGMFVQALKH